MNQNTIILDFADPTFLEEVKSALADDSVTGTLSLMTGLAAVDHVPANAFAVVVTEKATAAKLQRPDQLVILVGQTAGESEEVFAEISTDPDLVLLHVKRAIAYLEVIQANRQAMLDEPAEEASLPEVAHSLAGHLRQLYRQAQMRTALVDQLPVAVVGVDDRGMIALANNLAQSRFSRTMLGLSVDMVFPPEVVALLDDSCTNECSIVINGQQVMVRKSSFYLSDEVVGKVLVFWDC
jgi:hypothetical protein